MEIDANIFETFLKKVTLGGKIATAKFISQEDGLFTRLNLTNHIITEALLNKTAFHSYTVTADTKPEDIDIRDTTKFKNILNSFKDKIKVTIENPFIVLSSVNKTAHFKLASEVDNYHNEESKVEWDNGFDIPMKLIKDIIMNANNLESESILLEVKDNNLIITTEGQEDKIVEEMKVTYKDCIFSIQAEYFSQIFGVIDSENVNLSFQNKELAEKGAPIRILEKSKAHIFKIVVAPFSKD